MSKPVRLLQIEDSESDAALIVRLLIKAGYEIHPHRVETAEAMRLALMDQAWDIVIADYSLPRFDALAALRVLQQSGQDLPFVVVSGSIGEETAVELMRAGAHDYLMKDRLTRLAPAVERELREAETRRERRQAEAARRQSEEQLRQAQKMESIGQLAGGIAHDFNNILAATLLQVEWLQSKPALDAETRETLQELMVQTKRAASLTRQLLLFSRRTVMSVQVLNLAEVVENLLKMLRRLIGEDIRLDWQASPQPCLVSADAGMIEQLLMNLMVNARDAMPKGGCLSIRSEILDLTAEQARDNPQARPGRFACLMVADTGCGMDAAVLKRVFEPFFTTKEPGKGTGLGLATAYGIVTQHQGWITVQSAPGQGSTFRAYFPLASPDAVSHAAETTTEAVLGGSERILLVEDDVAVRKSLGTFLRRWGYRVVEAVHGVEALRLWGELHGDVDLLFTDMIMPEGMNGLELASKLRTFKPGLKVMVSSGYSTELVQQGAPVAHDVTYIPKPCSPLDLARAVRRCLDKPAA